MSTKTNLLVVKAKKLAAPAGALAVAALGATYLFGHNGLAASAMTAMDDSSVSSLLSLDKAVESVAARVSPAVVNVAVTSKGGEHEEGDSAASEDEGGPQGLPDGLAQLFGGGRGGRGGQQQQQPQGEQLQHGIGSGIIISPDGYIVTNNHVVDGAVQMKVTLNDRRVLTAKLVGVDKLTDLAVIKVNAKDLPYLPWGDSSQLHPGQTVLAFGSPFGYFRNSVTRGIVSAVNRQNPYSDDPRKPGGFIQTDAAINPGNSGGALVNAHGELIGINTFIISNSGSFAGAGFAIPSQIAKATADQLIKSGTVHHGYLGIGMNDVTPENSSFFGSKDAEGAIVAQVSPDSPASRAGLKSGDVINELNGQKIENSSSLQVAVSGVEPGTVIELGVLRNGNPQTVKLTVGEFKSGKEVASTDGPAAPQGGKLGLAIDNLTADVRQQLNVPESVQGVAIAQVRQGSPAEDAGLQPGDVILEVNRKPAGSAEQFVSAVHANPDGKDILLLVWSKGGSSYRVVHPDSGNQNGM
jgi:serine protease Do